MSTATVVCLEVGRSRVFASALDWPGWSRVAKTEEAAMEALGEYAGRYALVAERAGTRLPKTVADAFDVIERLPGDGGTDFGVPGKVAQAEYSPVDAKSAKRLADFVNASWATLADVAAGAPAELRKGPRCGGRDRDPIVAHVADAEIAYARKLGIRGIKDSSVVREAIINALGTPNDGVPAEPKGWPTPYAARRIAWHVLDHAWEIEDKS